MNWDRPNRIEQEYRRSITRLYHEIILQLKFESDPLEIAQKLNLISGSHAMWEFSLTRAVHMATQVNRNVGKTWREAARNAGRGTEIYNAILESLKQEPGEYFQIIQSNARYISSVPQESAKWITKHVQQESLRGRRALDIAEDVKDRYPKLMESRAQLIARTETSKAQTALTQSRAQNLGIDWYVWRTAEDGSRVRKSHQHMHGVLIRWSDPPSPEALAPNAQQTPYGRYHAGETFNCRCYPEPVVRTAFLEWPMKVYYGGRIQRMTKAEFEEIAGISA